jgi:formyltetrahydrofolate deformylase
MPASPGDPAPLSLTALLSGPDQPGLVARAAGWIYERGGNILHADQHRDDTENVFFQRLEWIPKLGIDPAVQGSSFRDFAADQLGMVGRVVMSTDQPHIALFVSKADHCFHDLALRFQAGEMRGKLSCILGNHEDLAADAAHYKIPFYYIPVTDTTKPAAEARQLEHLRRHGIALAILGRYMQVLSENFITRAGIPIINIHHSFLPAFAGGRPYHQAHARGVKLIGATAHYVTAKLDEGPIIAQDVTRVSHRHNINDLIRRGRDLEKLVLAQAVRWHLENRILVYRHKTVIFD